MPSINLSYEKIESLISEISLGGKMVSVLKEDGEPIVVFIAHCTGLDKARAELEYEKSYERAVEEGFLTAEETRELLVRKGVLEEVDPEKIERLESKIKGQEAYLAKLTRVPSRKNDAIDNLNRLKEELQQLLLKKEEGADFSADRIAAEQKYLYMTWRCTRNPYNKELYWLTKEDFDNESDLILRRNLFIETIKLSSGLSLETLRYLARNNIWRIRYLTSMKTGISLFGVELPNYSTDQLALAYWSHYYQSVYEMMPEDKPPEIIVEDDAALDAYMKSYMEEMERDATSARESKQMGSGVKSAWDHGETLVMKSNPLYEDVEYTETVESVRNKNKTDVKPKNPKSKKR